VTTCAASRIFAIAAAALCRDTLDFDISRFILISSILKDEQRLQIDFK
jgi:hypothetical protein